MLTMEASKCIEKESRRRAYDRLDRTRRTEDRRRQRSEEKSV